MPACVLGRSEAHRYSAFVSPHHSGAPLSSSPSSRQPRAKTAAPSCACALPLLLPVPCSLHFLDFNSFHTSTAPPLCAYKTAALVAPRRTSRFVLEVALPWCFFLPTWRRLVASCRASFIAMVQNPASRNFCLASVGSGLGQKQIVVGCAVLWCATLVRSSTVK